MHSMKIRSLCGDRRNPPFFPCAQGERGNPGPAGSTGSQGPFGARGPSGAPGTDGGPVSTHLKCYYENNTG